MLFLSFWSILAGASAQELQNPEFTKTVDGLLERTVPLITVDSLVERFEEVTVLDARPETEFEVGHLKGAQRVGFRDFDKARVQDLPKDKPIVVYCSVGYRSEKIGEKLQALGFSEVYNLYGGIFEWFNRDQPVFGKDEEPSDTVHPYDKNWGRWLKAE